MQGAAGVNQRDLIDCHTQVPRVAMPPLVDLGDGSIQGVSPLVSLGAPPLRLGRQEMKRGATFTGLGRPLRRIESEIG